MSEQIKSTTEGQTLILTISNPSMRNALGPQIYAAATEAITAAETNPEIRSIVITGEGDNFCAGGNLQRLLSNREKPREVQAQSIEGLHNWMDAIRTCPKPVIAAVEGAAAGAGFSLALMCDFIVAASNSIFVMAYSNIAISPDGGASWNLARALPRQLTSELLLLGERISAERLHLHGVVNQVCAPGEVLSHALNLAEKINQRAPNSMNSIKELISAASDQSLNHHLKQERDAFVDNLHHANAGVGIQAFLNKEKPFYK
jgi:enoyl-CoA hydratase/carnithine racemase